MNNQRQYQDYYVIKPGEISRDAFILFNDNPGHSVAEVKFIHPFHFSQTDTGRRSIGVACTQLSVPNTAMNIAHHLGNSNMYYGQTLVSLRDGYYENLNQIQDEIMFQLTQARYQDSHVKFVCDHLGHVTFQGGASLKFPLKDNKGDRIPDNLGAKLGFTSYDEENVEVIDGIDHMTVDIGEQALDCGDMFGPTSDCLVTCDECIYTRETERVLIVHSLAAHASRSQVHSFFPVRFRPLHDKPSVSELTLRLVDRLNRPLAFVSGTPSATIELQLLM